MTKKSILASIAAIILLALAFFGGYKHGQKRGNPCANCEIKRDTAWINDIDTVFQKGKSTVIKEPFKVEIPIVDTFQLDSLKRAAKAREAELLTQLAFYRDLQAALDTAGVGDIVIAEPPHYEVTGEVLSEDGTATVRYSITVTDTSAIVQGTPDKPNPTFFVELNKPVVFDVPVVKTGCKKYAVGGGFLFGTNGSNLNGMPIVNVRVNKTNFLGAYDISGKMWLFGVGRELQFGKRN